MSHTRTRPVEEIREDYAHLREPPFDTVGGAARDVLTLLDALASRPPFLAEPLTEHEEYCLNAVAGDGQGFDHPTYCLNFVDVVAQALRKRCPSKPSDEAAALAAELADARRARRFLHSTFRNGVASLYSLAESLINDRHEWIVKAQATPPPIPMLLTCPACGDRHIDVGEFATKPHHTHACQSCGTCWRPAVVATVGVQFLPGFKNAEATP